MAHHGRSGIGRRRHRKRRSQPGAAPGTWTIPADAASTELTLFTYGPESFEETSAPSLDDVRRYRGRDPVLWLDIVGLGDPELLQSLAEIFGLHALALEDVINVGQRPKVESYGEHLFIIGRMVALSDNALLSEQLSLFLGRGFLISFQEQPIVGLEPVRQRLRQGGKRLRTHGSDYLAYALLDSTIDHYFPVLEHYEDQIELLEDEMFERVHQGLTPRIQQLKRDLQGLRRTVWPMRDALSSMLREETPLISDPVRLYLRDSYDHTLQLREALEISRERGSALTDLYLSLMSNQMNEIMKTLTIMATIFIPLGFVAGLYGMNFDPEVSPWNMPELDWYFGYPFALALMVAVGGSLLFYFKRKGWIGTHSPRPSSTSSSPPPPGSGAPERRPDGPEG